ncbi:MAG: hypothetical protein ACOYMA_04660 [Bacteroidia bacterium]
MKNKLQKTIAIAFTSLLFVVACNKKDSTPNVTPTSKDFSSFEYSGSFSGSISSNSSSSPTLGNVTIDSEGAFILDLMAGRMKGSALKTGTTYNITISESTGIFKDVANSSGTIDVSNRILMLSGKDPDGSPITISGTTPEVLNTGGWEKLKKSAVLFTHNESCKASITIDGVTLSGLNNHYETGGLCSPTYALSNTLLSNHDSLQSMVYCHSGKIKGLNGQTVSFTDCNTAAFYLNKNTLYDYTVNWENGQTSTGSFTSPDGGGQKPICISNEGPECKSNSSLGTFSIGVNNYIAAKTLKRIGNVSSTAWSVLSVADNSGNNQRIDVYLRDTLFTSTTIYPVIYSGIINSAPNSTSLPFGKAAIVAQQGFDVFKGHYESSGGGTVTVTVLGGKVTNVKFSNIPVFDIYEKQSTTVSGNFNY